MSRARLSWPLMVAYKFVRQASEILSSVRGTSIFLITAGAHDEREIRLIKNLFPVHLVFGNTGLSVSKQS